jgi:endonuclease-3
MKNSSPRELRMKTILPLLKATYPNAHCELNFQNPLQLLIATILSAQCTDVRVNLVTPELFRRFPTAHDLASAPLWEIEKLVQSTGFYRNKARNIKACCQALVDHHDGQVPRTMEDLVQLAGVGRKTANVVLGNAYNLNEGVVVDTHVSRLSQRLGLTRQTDPVKIEIQLMKLVPRPDWTLFSHLLIWHGRRRCTARNPNCPSCELNSLCPSASRAA